MTRRCRCAAHAAATFLFLFPVAKSAAAEQAAAPAVAPEAVRQEIAALRQELDLVRRQYDERLRALEERLLQIQGAPPGAGDLPPAPDMQAAPAPVVSQAPATTIRTSGQIFNPDISVNGNFLASAGRNEFNAEPALQLSEAEVSFQAVVDPYARADVYLAASPEGVEIEEGYATFTALPAGLLVKAGKMRAQFGKVNTLHTHAMPTVDRPLVIENLLGGDEGLSDGGVSVSRLIGNPWIFLEATGEAYGGQSEVFQSTGRDHPAYVARIRGYRDLTEDQNIEVASSYAFGPTAGDEILEGGVFNKHLFGVDATYRYRPLRRAIYSRFNLRTELVWSRQGLPDDQRATAFGFYGLGEYQFARRWYVGGRIDRSGRVFDGSLADRGASVFLTFWPTEFSQLRTQYRRTRYAEDVTADEVFFQFNFSIGAHAAHAF